ncbi:pitrilysin family protein [Xanthomarina sp. F1114]|uniref:M16 family metallopeptidase n=1 Tax=Xanthomarina sp. F1114 TaxID=2996019 RepID=UPI00225E3349|nr:pitrilysin family protein [Xanthomarina sp. F1114]MCX7547205.1 pitrilysin family protein [Xanthomarina sp. F1114]
MTNKKKFSTLLMLAFLVAPFFMISQELKTKFEKVSEMGEIEEYLYQPNGMEILLLQDNSAPVVTVQIVYRVGSKHEVSGNTGSTHLLEHLMFKGTEKFNKTKGTSIDSKLTSIGAQMNATTWNDRTNYYQTIPSDKIEIALDIEADRMRNSLLLKEDKEAEMTVVRNEFERGENNPNSVLRKEIWAAAYMAHTYHHSTIGWRSDIENMSMEALRNFYDTYYWPNNATLTIVGDFQKDNLFQLIDKHFGVISKAPHVMPQPITKEPKQYGPRKVVIKKAGQQGVINVTYKIPGRLHEDLPALTVLGEIIGSGPSSLLTKNMVDKGLAYYGYASPSQFQEVGLFTIGLGFEPTSDHDSLNKKVLDILEQVKTEGVKQEEVDRIIAKINAETILYRDGSASISAELTEVIAAGDWKEFFNANTKLAQVTAEDVKRVANTYLVEDQSTTGYFIPVIPGANKETAEEANKVFEADEFGKFYYRHPEHTKTDLEAHKLADNRTAEVLIVEQDKDFERKTIAGIDVISKETGAKDFITVAASFAIGEYLAQEHNEMVPSLTTQLLSKGTLKNDKIQFSQKLEKLGVNISVSADSYNVNMSFKCLKKDLNTVVELLAEELRYPLFDEDEFQLIKDQNIGQLKQGLLDPSTMGNIALLQIIYPEGHPNYATSIEALIEEVQNTSIEDVKAFHKKYFGPKSMHLVAIGDVDAKPLYKAISTSFKGWKGGVDQLLTSKEIAKVNAETKIITIPEKPSAEMIIAQFTGLNRLDKDFLPFYIGNSVFGGGFSGRLMRTVRDEDGLTYSIGSGHSGHTYNKGYWMVKASFNPELFQQGLDATMVQLEKWVNQGITQEELDAKKTNITGSFKVGMATTTGLAGTILNFVKRGQSPDYMYQYSKDIEAVTLEQVNAAIKKYIDLDKLIIVKSGSLDENGKPLE